MTVRIVLQDCHVPGAGSAQVTAAAPLGAGQFAVGFGLREQDLVEADTDGPGLRAICPTVYLILSDGVAVAPVPEQDAGDPQLRPSSEVGVLDLLDRLTQDTDAWIDTLLLQDHRRHVVVRLLNDERFLGIV